MKPFKYVCTHTYPYHIYIYTRWDSPVTDVYYNIRKKPPSALVCFNFCCYFFMLGCSGPSLLHGLFFSCGAWASHRSDFSCCRAWTVSRLQSTGSVVLGHRLSCPGTTLCGIFPNWASNPCLLCILYYWATRKPPWFSEAVPCSLVPRASQKPFLTEELCKSY